MKLPSRWLKHNPDGSVMTFDGCPVVDVAAIDRDLTAVFNSDTPILGPIRRKSMIWTFDHQTASPQDIARIEKVRQAFRPLEQELFSVSANPPVGCVMPICSPGRMTSLAKTKLEEACMWAIKGIVFEDKGLA